MDKTKVDMKWLYEIFDTYIIELQKSLTKITENDYNDRIINNKELKERLEQNAEIVEHIVRLKNSIKDFIKTANSL